MRRKVFLITCEHASNCLPHVYKRFFEGAEEVLASHEGWDPGALSLATAIADQLDCELVSYGLSRLLIEVNRSVWHHQLFSRYTKGLSVHDREYLIGAYYYPYRNGVEERIRNLIREGNQVIHLSVHSFTPNYFGTRREVQIGLLFDNYSDQESAFCASMKGALEDQSSLIVKSNEPYEGAADGFTTYLRRRFPENQYLGLELEVSQQIVMDQQVQDSIIRSLVLLSFGFHGAITH